MHTVYLCSGSRKIGYGERFVLGKLHQFNPCSDECSI